MFETELKGQRSGGVREVMRIALPLILASSGNALCLFCDRAMLTRYAPGALQAVLPAGLSAFVMMSFFIGISGYAATFVAQYTGAKRDDQVGPSIWQGAYLALGGGLAMALVSAFASGAIFRWINHPPDVRHLETTYFAILAAFGVFPLMHGCLCGFWTGRGKTWTVMWLELFITVINIFCNYLLIFGHWGLPEMGIAGAAFGTVIAWGLGALLTWFLFLLPGNRKRFNTFPTPTFNPARCRRLLRFGLPNGISFMLDIASFNVFIILLGYAGRVAQVAGNMAFSINLLAFLPMTGIGMAVCVLVGHGIGAHQISHAKRAVRSARLIVLGYLGTIAVSYLLLPQLYIRIFAGEKVARDPEISAMAADFMAYIAAFLLFDGFFIVYNSAIKGAGDTRFAMTVGVALAWGLFAVPCMIISFLGGEQMIWWLWRTLVFYIIVAGLVFYARYRGGKWKRMRVIEQVEEIPIAGEPAVVI